MMNQNQKIKVLLIAPLPKKHAFGGISVWSIQYLSWCENRSDIEVKIIDNAAVDKNGVDISYTKNIFKKTKYSLLIKKKVKEAIENFEPNLIHFNSSCSPFGSIRDKTFIKIFNKYNIKTVFHCRCNIEDQLRNSKIGRAFFKWNCNHVDSVLTLNNASYDFVKKNGQANVYKVGNFIDAKKIINQKTINKEIKQVVFVGHMEHKKGFDDVIFAAKEHPHYSFVACSPITDEFSFLKNHPLPNLIITGQIPHEEVLKILDESDVFFFPTHTEGFSNALLEAMARGLPVITNKSAGANYDMLENDGAFYCEPSNYNQLIEVFNKIKDPKIRQSMSSWNATKVKNSYTVDQSMQELMKIYNIVLL